jgi:Chaperone of endosialidase
MASTINASTAGGGGIVSTADSSGVLQLQTAGTTAVTVDASQNVGIGTSSPSTKLQVTVAPSSSSDNGMRVTDGTRIIQSNITGSAYSYIGIGASETMLYSTGNPLNIVSDGQPIKFIAGNAERMRIDSSGNVLVNTTSTIPGNLSSGKLHVVQTSSSGHAASFKTNATSGFAAAAFSRDGNNGGVCEFMYNPTTTVGSISVTSSATAYNTSSDYRLKENIAPMVGALDTVAQLKPVTYKWKSDGSDGQGFIAHELQAVIPDCVTGEKDAVDEEGNPVYQGIDTSFLVATLTAAIQELSAKVAELEAKVGTL